MLAKEDVRSFIEEYEGFYFGVDDKDGIQSYFEKKRINSTEKEDEREIMKILEQGCHNADAIAWKLGVYKRDKKVGSTVRGFDLTEYIKYIEENKMKLINHLYRGLKKYKICEMDAVKEFNEVFKLLKEKAPNGFGNVYFINTMFFLTKGAIPIYDKNAFRAVQALYLVKNPKLIKASDAPNSNNSIEAAFRLIEYMLLLDEVFGDNRKIKSTNYTENNADGYFISRGVDRALWVYGQSCKQFIPSK